MPAPRRPGLPRELIALLGQQWGAPVVDELRRKRAARNEPHARLQRRRRVATHRLLFLLLVVAVFAVIGVLALLSSPVQVVTLVVAACGVLFPGVLAVRTGATVVRVRRQLAVTPRTQPRAAEPTYRLPPLSSRARQPLQRLASAESRLADLLEQLLPGSAVAPVPPEAIASARSTADDAAAELRRLAGQLRSVERAIPAAGKDHRAELTAAVDSLRARLDEGLESYGHLVAAAGQVVAASASPGSQEALTDATDRLAGLADALAELADMSYPGTPHPGTAAHGTTASG